MLTCGLFLTNFSLAIDLCSRDFRDELVAQAAWHLGVFLELHGKGGAALSAGSQVGGVAEHRRQRDQAGDDLYTRPRLDASDLSAHCAEVADDVADVRDRANHLDAHDRLEQDRPGRLRCLSETLKSRGLERGVG